MNILKYFHHFLLLSLFISCYSNSVFAEAALCEVSFLAPQSNDINRVTLSSIIGQAQSKSFAALEPNAYQQIVSLQRTLPSYLSFFPDRSIPSDMLAHEVIRIYIEGVHLLGLRLKDIAQSISLSNQQSRRYKSALIYAASNLDAYYEASSPKSHWFLKVEKKRWDGIYNETTSETTYGQLTPEQEQKLYNNMAVLHSFWMELLIAMNLDYWTTNGTHFQTLPSLDAATLSSIHLLEKTEGMQEIDILWKNTPTQFSIGEVKTGRSPLSTKTKPFQRIYEQIKRLVKTVKKCKQVYLNMKYIYSISIHVCKSPRRARKLGYTNTHPYFSTLK